MSEVFVWPEGQIYLWTGTATASALVAFVQNSQAIMQYGWESHQTVDGVYSDHQTGQRADLTVQALYSYDITALRMILSATAVHVKLHHSGIHGSGGMFLYSGRVDVLALGGSEGLPYSHSISYHANAWSGY